MNKNLYVIIFVVVLILITASVTVVVFTNHLNNKYLNDTNELQKPQEPQEPQDIAVNTSAAAAIQIQARTAMDDYLST